MSAAAASSSTTALGSTAAFTGDIVSKSAPMFLNFCSKAAPWTALAVCAAPLPTIRQIQKDRDVGELPLLPYSSLVVNAFVWTVYGLLIGKQKVWLTNAVGTAMGIYYWRAFQKICPPTAKKLPGTLSNHFTAATIIILLTSALATMLSTKTAISTVGMEGVLFCVLLFASPLAKLKDVIASRSAKSIPLPFSVIATANTVMWSVVGWFEMNDPAIWAPNMMGFVFSFLQLALKFVYGDGPSETQARGTAYAVGGPRGGGSGKGGGFNLPV